ncbi:unnamed protein product [Thelazia callipaeda]|uniref:Neuroguidin n=1 Tax=Thelazia callipaeda TaxID=103827 RepID=A0A0N5D1D0_THECL|nr:unnamed protein product [Thelazia callipaeda]
MLEVEQQRRYASIVADCAKTSTKLLEATRRFHDQLLGESIRNGISLYEVKNHDLLVYTRDLAYLMYVMGDGNSIQGNAAIERLVYLRTVLERTRPIEYKLKNYIERLISLTTDVGIAKVLRPHPEQLQMDDERENLETDDDDLATGEAKPKKYVPPKVMALHYNEDDEEAEARKMERARRRALQSSLIQDLRAQYSEAPEEFLDDTIVRKKKQEDIERQKYEEDYLIRLQMTKKQKHNKRLKDRQNILDDLLHFGNYMAVSEVKNEGKGAVRDKARGKRKKVGSNNKSFKKPRFGSKNTGKVS